MEKYIKIKNIGQSHQPLNFFVVGLSGQDVPVTLSLGEFLYTPKQDTRNLIIYSRKNILSIEDAVLPNGVELYRVYSDATMPTVEPEAAEQMLVVEQTHEEVTIAHEAVEQAPEALQEQPTFIESAVNPVAEQLTEPAVNSVAEQPAEKKKETKKRKRVYKKKLGRPKKRGPKPKKKPIGRPRKNK